MRDHVSNRIHRMRRIGYHEDFSESANILFVITDDQSWEHVGAYGDQAVRTPAMDRLAKNGILFENTFPTGFNHYHTRLMIAFNVQFVV